MTTHDLWKTILSKLEIEVSKATFGTFFSKTSLVSLTEEKAIVGCPNAVVARMLEGRYTQLIADFLSHSLGHSVSVSYKVLTPETNVVENMGPLFTPPIAPLPQPKILPRQSRHMQLRPDLTFETFAVSTSNHMAYAAATAVAQSPGNSYNPLFFYGGVGVGKTHLMQAIGNSAKAQNQDLHIIYCMGEEFTNEIIDAIQSKTTKKFKDNYRSANLLLIDDIQFIAGKNTVQEEFFHTFNTIHRSGGQIVMTSDRPPHEIAKLEERLRSRFEAGLIVDVQNPDFELRCAIIRIKAQQKGIPLDMTIAQILAASTDSVRKLEGLLTRLMTEVTLKKVPISEELARQIVGLPQQETDAFAKQVTPKQATEAVVKRFGVTMAQLKGPKRNRMIVRPRQILMYLLRIDLKLPFEEVGALVGGRDHTTVMHAVEQISALITTDVHIREDILLIKRELFGTTTN